MKLAAIVNGSSSKVRAIVKSLNQLKDITVLITKSATEMVEFAKKTREDRYDVVLIAGGDGSLNAVVNEWMKSKDSTLPAIGVLPFGSANDFSKTFGYYNLQSILENAQNGISSPVDVIEINAYGDVQYCLNMCNNGMGANIARSVAKRRNRLPGTFNYLSATIGWLMAYRAPKVKIMVDDYVLNTYATIISIGNGKFAGDGMGLCPQAEVDDSQMAATIIGKVNLFDFLNYYPKLKNAKKIDDPRLVYTSGSLIKIYVEKGLLSIETDGEFVKTLSEGQHAKFTIKHAALQIIRPF